MHTFARVVDLRLEGNLVLLANNMGPHKYLAPLAAGQSLDRVDRCNLRAQGGLEILVWFFLDTVLKIARADCYFRPVA